MKRRAMLAGFGMMLTGSGIITTSAAFGDSVSATSDFRVIAAKDLRVRAGQAFADDGSVNDGYEDHFVEYEEAEDSMFFDNAGGLNDISKDEIPVATVNSRDENNNDDLVIETAISLDDYDDDNDPDVVFEDILEIENRGTSTKSVGISYDRDQEQYGDDVETGGDDLNELTDGDVQSVYRFVVDNQRISPDERESGDDPETFVEIDAGETRAINLEIDLSEWGGRLASIDPKEHILDAANLDGDPFEGQTDTVDMLDGITVGTEEE